MKAILEEHCSVWEKLVSMMPSKKPVGICEKCRMSKAAQDVAAWVAAAEALRGDIYAALPEAL